MWSARDDVWLFETLDGNVTDDDGRVDGDVGQSPSAVVRGDEYTAWNIALYAASLVPLSILLWLFGGLSLLYVAAALVLGLAFVVYAARLVRAAASRRRALARSTYLYSLFYLALLFVTIMVDSSLRL